MDQHQTALPKLLSMSIFARRASAILVAWQQIV